jgi:hypothetical protein
MLEKNTTEQSQDVCPILWTGGWDSTFRLLTLLLREGRTVRPYYILDDPQYRRSVPAERAAMQRIRRLLASHYPGAQSRLLATIECALDSIAPDAELARHYEGCLHRGFIGGQYEFLARFCSQRNIRGMELAIHRDDKAREMLAPLIAPDRQTLDPKFAGDCRYELFKCFRFPVFDTTKAQMRAAAAQGGFAAMMNETWFCHEPRNNRPCGVCNPCIYTIEEGLADRIPLAGRIRYNLRVVPRVRHWLARHPNLYMPVRAAYRKLRGRKTTSATQRIVPN